MLKQRLGAKFISLVVVILTLTLGLYAYSAWRGQQQQLEAQLEERGRLLGHFIALLSPEALLSFDFLRLNEYAREVTHQPDVVYGVIVDPHGRALTSYVNLSEPLIRPLVPLEVRHPNIGRLLRDLEGRPELVNLDFPITHDGKTLAYLLVGISRQQLLATTQRQLLQQLMIYAAVILFLSVGIYWVFRWNVLQPVTGLIGASRQVSKGDFPQVPVETEDELGVLADAFNSMVDAIRTERAKLHYQANYDPLTDLPNRMMAKERLTYQLGLARRGGHRLAVLCIDLDDFKAFNDSYGHGVGDQLLVTLGGRFQECLREVDTIARLGGDEFLVLLPHTEAADAIEQIAERLAATVAEPITLAERDVSLQCSIGIAVYPDDGDTAEQLMANGDNAMYQAKNQPRNSICFYTPEMNQRVQERLQLEQDLNLALERGQFRLNLQPLVDVKTQRPCGAEVLLRWRHPEKGEISPAEFIPLAETTGQIVAIGDWVLRRAAILFRELADAGLHPSFLAVNVSRLQFNQRIAQRVAQVVAEYRLPPGALELELTESVLMDDLDVIQQQMNQLRLMGVRLALDDFGTGYASLSYLKRFRFDQLKIDRSFIAELPEDAGSVSLVRAIVAMANGLGLKVVAEGVETDAQLGCIARLGCDLVQGYHLGRPMEADAYRDYLKRLQLDVDGQIGWKRDPR